MAKIFFKNKIEQYEIWDKVDLFVGDETEEDIEIRITNPEKQLIITVNKKVLEVELRPILKAIQVQAKVKPANADLNIIAGIYAILQSQLSCIWNKISGKERLANKEAEELIIKIKAFNEELGRRLSV